MTQTSLIDINSLIHSKNKSSKNWYEHNFLFNKISELLGEKLKEFSKFQRQKRQFLYH